MERKEAMVSMCEQLQKVIPVLSISEIKNTFYTKKFIYNLLSNFLYLIDTNMIPI